jgi:hypothetical protein
MPSKKLKNITEKSQMISDKDIQNLYVTSRLPLSDDAFVWTDWFPFGSQSFNQWIKSKQIGTYLFRHKKKGFFMSKKISTNLLTFYPLIERLASKRKPICPNKGIIRKR